VVGASLTNQNQSSATAQSSTASDQTSSQVNTLNQIYPNTQQNLYPIPSTTQQADTPQPVRFVNVDQILVAARASEQIPAAMHQVAELLRERHHIRPESRMISPFGT
jgi:macrolide transport system ATP-binding/permease protein